MEDEDDTVIIEQELGLNHDTYMNRLLNQLWDVVHGGGLVEADFS